MVGDALQKTTGQPQGSMKGDARQDLRHWWDLLQPLFAELILVAPDPLAELGWEGLIVRGQYRFQTPLAAVRAALLVAQHDQLLIVDPTLPMVTPEIVATVATKAEQRWDVIALGEDMETEAVPMVFHKRCLKMMDHLTQTDYTMKDFYHQVRHHTMDINAITH